LIGAACNDIENILQLATRCCVNSNFLNLCKVTVCITVISSELVVQIFVLQSLLDVSGKGKFDGTSRKFGLSLNSTKAHEKRQSAIVAIMAVLRNVSKLDNRFINLENSREINNHIAYNLK
jgi:hypothetical protein